MEIISYVGGFSAARVGAAQLPKIGLPKLRLRPFYPLLALKKIGSFLWLLPVLAAVALVPFAANKAFELMQSRANPLSLKNEAVDELAGQLEEILGATVTHKEILTRDNPSMELC